jgi:hypothetical protein
MTHCLVGSALMHCLQKVCPHTGNIMAWWTSASMFSIYTEQP